MPQIKSATSLSSTIYIIINASSLYLFQNTSLNLSLWIIYLKYFNLIRNNPITILLLPGEGLYI